MTATMRFLVAAWSAVSLAGCSVATTSTGGADAEGRTVTVGLTTGGDVEQQALDRTVVPDVGDPLSLEFPEIQDYTLDNGLRVVLVERHALPLVSLELQFRGGASAHPAEQAGLAALTADMLDEGTATRSALEIADAIDLLGATLSSTAGYDASQLRLSVLRTRFPDALDILADVVLHPAFPEPDLERVRQERLARIIQRSDVPGALADNAFIHVLYGADHPYGVPLIGTEESLRTLTRGDVSAFFTQRYAPGQATLIVAGDVAREDLDALLAEAFAGWRGAGEDPPVLPEVAVRTERTLYLVNKDDAAQSEVRVGRVAVGRSTADYYPLSVLNTVLGGSFTSRLNSKLREEKGYTYGAGSFFDMRKIPGPFEAASAVATPVTDSAVADFVVEIDRMRDEVVPDAELDRARNYVALQLPQRFESLDDVVRRLSELALYGVPLDFYEGYVEGVEAVSAVDIRRAAAAHLGTDRMVIVIAGDLSVIEEPVRSLGLGRVEVLGPMPPSRER